MCLLLERRLSLHDFMCDFPVLGKCSFWSKNRFFLEIPVFPRIFWSGVVGAINTFVAENVVNMLSWLK